MERWPRTPIWISDLRAQLSNPGDHAAEEQRLRDKIVTDKTAAETDRIAQEKVMKEKLAAQRLAREKATAWAEADRMAHEKAATWRTAADKVAAAETGGGVREKAANYGANNPIDHCTCRQG